MNYRLLLSVFTVLGLFIAQSCAVTDDNGGDDSEKFIGTWSVSDNASRLNYSVTILVNPSNSTEILLNNFADLNTSAVGLVVGNSVVIDSQSLGSDYLVFGTGSFVNNGKLEFSFSLNDGIDSESRVATFTN